MKKLFFVLTAAVITCIACNKDIENHETTLYRPSSGTSIMAHADQKWDSITFITTESYTLASDVAWCQIPEEFRSLNNPYVNTLVLCTAPFYLVTNTSGKARIAIITIQAGEYSVTASIYQYPFLYVQTPTRNYLNGQLNELEVEAKETSSEIAFTVYDDWTLTPQEGLWMHVNTEQQTGHEGSNNVALTFDENSTGADRRDTLLLKSRGVTDKIPVVQLKKQ